jgi:hypothetical protein
MKKNLKYGSKELFVLFLLADKVDKRKREFLFSFYFWASAQKRKRERLDIISHLVDPAREPTVILRTVDL